MKFLNVLVLVVACCLMCSVSEAGQRRDARKAKRDERLASKQVSSSVSVSKSVTVSRGKCSCNCEGCTCGK